MRLCTSKLSRHFRGQCSLSVVASVSVSLACLALIRLADPEKHPHMLDAEEDVAVDGGVRRDDILVDIDEAVGERTGSSSSGP